MPNIHPTAIISKDAILTDDVTVGPLAVIEGPCTLGPGTVIRARAHLVGPITLGARNIVFPNATLGDWPQDRKYKDDNSQTIIGDDNIFREGTTVHRGTGANTKTVIGHRNYFMINAHVGHNCIVGNDVTMINNSVIAGHVQLFDKCIIGAQCGIHQFCRVGTLAMLSHNVVATVDLPPYFISLRTNHLTQLNSVGLRRSGMSKDAINAIRRMFQFVYRTHTGQPVSVALDTLPEDIAKHPEVQAFVAFCKQSKRGLARFQKWSQRNQADEEAQSDPNQNDPIPNL